MRSHRAFWLVDRNPFQLPEPAPWWQADVLAYDALLRLMPSQTDRCYRLCRIAPRGHRLGDALTKAADLHRHPDTVAMATFGVVPELTLAPHAILSHGMRALLRARDAWTTYPNAEARIAAIEAAEQIAADAVQRDLDAHLDAVSADSFRHIRYGYRTQLDAPQIPPSPTVEPLRPLPPLPASPAR